MVHDWRFCGYTSHMVKKKAFVLVLLFLMALTLLRPIGAEEAVRLSDLDCELSDEFYMLTAVDLLAQGQAKGGLLCFDGEMNYIYGYSTAGTPEDFFTNVPPSTLTMGLVLPIRVIEALYLTLGDAASYAVLEGLLLENKTALVAVVLCKVENDVILEDAVYNVARKQLEEASVANGLDPDEMYSLFGMKGIAQQELVGRVTKGESPSAIAIEALSIRKTVNRQDTQGRLPVGFIAISVMVCIILGLWALLGRARDKMNKD